ncbi:glycosyltransferase [Candidatus Saccharibacteria bacterium]|nr:glycosyltransferase [Candidatus Saccharibacteria bacterium]
MKKITIITMQLKTPGGIERFVSTIATMFAKNYNVEIIANYGKSSNPTTFKIPSNIKITYLTPNQPAEISLKNLITKFKWHKIPGEFKRRINIVKTRNRVFKKCLENLQTDIIITERSLYNSLVNRYYKGEAQKIATDHNFHQNNQKYISELINSLKTFDYLVVATEELKKFYENKIKPTKCLYIPNPIPNIPAKKSPLNTKNLISVGRLVPEKDFPLLINVMEKIHQKDPEIKLTIVGDGLERKNLEQLIKVKNLNSCIKITGFLPQSEIANYYYDSSLFVLTSKTEAFGLVLTEAMSYGLPCLALARASGARAQITPTTGVLVDSTNPTQIANEIINLLNNRSKLQKFQKNLNSQINHYSPQTIYQAWQKIIRK